MLDVLLLELDELLFRLDSSCEMALLLDDDELLELFRPESSCSTELDDDELELELSELPSAFR